MPARAVGLVLMSALLLSPGHSSAETVENFYGAGCPDGVVLRIGAPAPSNLRMLGYMLPMPDGRTIVVAGNDGWIRIFDASTGVVLRELGPQPGGFWREMSLSQDGKTLASQPVGKPSSIFIWSLETGRLLRTIDRGEWISDVALSPDGSLLVWGHIRSPFKVIDVKSGVELPVPREAVDGIVSLGLSADGRRLVASGVDGTVRLFDLRENRLLQKFSVEKLSYAAISPDGARVVTRFAHQVTILDESADWKRVSFSPECAYRVVISPDGRLLATSSGGVGGQPQIQIWDMANGAKVSCLAGSYACDPPVFVQGGELLLSNDDSKLRMWHVPTGTEVECGSGHPGRAYFVAWSQDGRSLISAGTEGTLRRWNATSGAELSRVSTPGAAPSLTNYLPLSSLAGNRLALSQDNAVISIWNLDNDQELRQFSSNRGSFRGMALSPDGTRLASVSDGTLLIRLVTSGELKQKFEEPKEEVEESWGGLRMINQGYVSWSPDGRLIAWSDQRDRDHVCNLEAGTMKTLTTDGRVLCASFSPDGKRLLFGRYFREPVIVNVETGESQENIELDPIEATAIAWSPDGRKFSVGAALGDLYVCDSTSGKNLRKFQAARVPIRSLAFSPQGDRLASAGDDGALLIWSLAETESKPAVPDFASAWRDLCAANGPVAASALAFFRQSGDAGAEELARRLEGEILPEDTPRWIAELDSEDAARRRGARESLEDAGVLVESSLHSAAEAASPEAAAAIREILADLSAPLVRSRGSLRRLRSLQVIEALGTPRARELLSGHAQRSTSAIEKVWVADCLRRLH